ncbi:hypothetical protein BSKO_10276 [Bryopsis sp. KO-2023]|nr:hypothetical protein BSKO_10276 [Bryopsis sp. KO-2023]
MPLGIEHVARGIAKRARRGLFAGKNVMFGNKVSEDGENKSRRQWKPNVQTKRLYSETLDQMVKLRVTTHALGCIDRAGGLDHYLMRTPEKKLDSDIGMALKQRISHIQSRRKAKAQELQKSDSAPSTGPSENPDGNLPAQSPGPSENSDGGPPPEPKKIPRL